MTDESLLASIKIWQLVAALLVAVGVAAEFGLEWMSRPVERRIDAAAAVQIEEMKERAAKAERDLLEFKERQNDRTLTDEQYLRLRGALRAGPKARVEIMFVDQREPKRFAELLVEVLTGAGWNASIVKWNRAGLVSPGVWIESAQGSVSTKATARHLALQLVRVGTPVLTSEAVHPPLAADLVAIRVGPRPR